MRGHLLVNRRYKTWKEEIQSVKMDFKCSETSVMKRYPNKSQRERRRTPWQGPFSLLAWLYVQLKVQVPHRILKMQNKVSAK